MQKKIAFVANMSKSVNSLNSRIGTIHLSPREIWTGKLQMLYM